MVQQPLKNEEILGMPTMYQTERCDVWYNPAEHVTSALEGCSTGLD